MAKRRSGSLVVSVVLVWAKNLALLPRIMVTTAGLVFETQMVRVFRLRVSLKMLLLFLTSGRWHPRRSMLPAVIFSSVQPFL